MNAPLCREVDEEIAVALLTRKPLPPAIARHLDDCPPCRRQFQDLADVRRLLDATRELEPVPAEPAGPDLLERLLAEMSRQRRRRRVVVLLAAAAAVIAVLVPGGLWLGGVLPGSANHPPAAVGTGHIVAAGHAFQPATGVSAKVEIRAYRWGSDVSVSATGMAVGTVCRIVVVDGHGAKEVAGSWTVAPSYGVVPAVHETVHTPAAQIASVDLVNDTSGSLLLTVPVVA